MDGSCSGNLCDGFKSRRAAGRIDPLGACTSKYHRVHNASLRFKEKAPAALLADQAGRHMSTRLAVPPNITIIAQPPMLLLKSASHSTAAATGSLSRAALMTRAYDNGQDRRPLATQPRLTNGPGWSRVMGYAAAYKPDYEALDQFQPKYVIFAL
jgi:hypothetical protein